MFGKEPVLSDECIAHIKILNHEGIKLTFSTARTYRTVDRILRDVPVPIPVSLMNGMMIRDVKNGLTLDVKRIPDPVADKAGKSFLDSGTLPLVYRYKDGEMLTYYSEITGENMRTFIDERIRQFGKPFIKVTREELFKTGPDSLGDVIYFCAIVKDSEGDELLNRLNGVENVCLTSYKDNASDSRYVEIYSPNASKKSAVQYLKRFTGADKLVSFGDNFNDLTMFEVSDLCFAPAGSPEKVVLSATGTVEPPEECGVTRKIAEMTGIRL
ncbi:MAG: HAD family phosphatase [Clostridia bacterium]|nr:HAD family phosphatase [Clostridia bacterium]